MAQGRDAKRRRLSKSLTEGMREEEDNRYVYSKTWYSGLNFRTFLFMYTFLCDLVNVGWGVG